MGTAMVQRVLFVQESRLRTATTSQERSKWRYAKLMCTGTARSSPISSHSLLKSKIVISNQRNFVSLMKTRPKKAKKYSYTKDCKEQPREICDQCEKKSLRPVCEMQERLECVYNPVEKCRDEPKEYCHKVERVELVEECDMKFDTSYL